MDRKYFGTDGIRGVANGEQMTPELALELGRALGALLKTSARTHQVVIGKDTRLSGYMLETALSSGLCSVGVDVWLCGPLPTPGVAFLTHSMRADAGVVISASHNPFEDNGIKIFAADGFKLPDERELEIEKLMFTDALKQKRAHGSQIGKAHRIDDAVGRYVVHCKSAFPKDLDLGGLKIVVDCAHGAAYRAAPLVFRELGAQVVAIGDTPDGVNINAGFGALHPEKLRAAVREHRADIGIALDGDADRVIIVDEKGEAIDGDQILAVLAKQMHASGALKGGTVVATVMSNIGLDRAVSGMGLKLERTAVGDRYVVQRMREGGFNLGGEQSGHVVCLDHGTTGDGVVAALLVLAEAGRTKKPVSSLRGVMEVFPQALVNVKVSRRVALDTLPNVKEAIAAAETTLGQSGRVLVRFSGTELKVRVMVEGPDKASVDGHCKVIAGEIEKVLA
ncbi:MAG: phosphoglucosamine mutase [Deltaproteobacteria bacterium]|nr:phosphoglucosamine mutase [Deltaproteobacteria bacterium]